MGCLWCGKYSRQCKTMPSRRPEFISPFIPVTGMKFSYGKISCPLTEISGTKPARPLIWTHRKFYKGFRGEARFRKRGQPGQPGSYEESLSRRYCVATLARIPVVIFACKRLQIFALATESQAIANHPEKKKFGTSTGFEPMASALALQCSANWAMKTHALGAG